MHVEPRATACEKVSQLWRMRRRLSFGRERKEAIAEDREMFAESEKTAGDMRVLNMRRSRWIDPWQAIIKQLSAYTRYLAWLVCNGALY